MADRLDPPPSPEDVPHEDPPPRVIHLSLLSSGDAPLDPGFGGGERSHGFGNFLDSAFDSARASSASPALLQSVARADEGNGPAAQARPAESPSFLVFDRGNTFPGRWCSSARSSAGRRFSRRLVCQGRASGGSRQIFGGPATRPRGIVGRTWYVLPLYLS